MRSRRVERGAAVTDVVATHMHYDHIGNPGVLPNARYHLQDCEMAYATGRCMCHPFLNHPYEVEDVVHMVRRVYGGMAQFHVLALGEGQGIGFVGEELSTDDELVAAARYAVVRKRAVSSTAATVLSE